MAEAQSSILIVDDDAEDLGSVERSLRGLGSALVTIRDPHEVMPGVHRHRPDVVIIDALLPGLSGFDLCKQIKSEPQLKGTQVLILTGVYLRQQYRHEALQQFKADAFLTKPFRPPELQRLVVQLLARKTRLPQSSFLKRLGLPGAEPKKRGFLGRIFGRNEEEEPASLRISPPPREPSPAAAAEPPVPTQAARVDAVPENAIESPRAKAPRRKAKKVEKLAPPEAVEEQAILETVPAAPALEEPVESEKPASAPEVLDAVETPRPSPTIEEERPEPEVAAVEPEPPEPSPPSPLPETAESTVAAPETASAEEDKIQTDEEEEPSPITLLEAPPPREAEEVNWVEAKATTQEMTLQEAADRVAEAEKPPAAFEDLAAAETELEDDPKTIAQSTRRPLLRVGEVPIYDEPDFLRELKRELSKCRRVDRPLTLILIRIGDLGQIVELFGKDFRERVLWHIAEQAMESLREVDLVGMVSSKSLVAMTAFASDRYGGGRIVARLRQAVTRKPFRVGEELPPIIPALDFGMASFPADGNEVESLILRAEEDLTSGRDRPAPLD